MDLFYPILVTRFLGSLCTNFRKKIAGWIIRHFVGIYKESMEFSSPAQTVSSTRDMHSFEDVCLVNFLVGGFNPFEKY